MNGGNVGMSGSVMILSFAFFIKKSMALYFIFIISA